jgi:DNA modification methylase
MDVRRVPIDSIHLDPGNARLHGDENMAAIEASLRRFGQVEPLVIQQRSGRIIGGNGRVVAMKKLGWTECDVVHVDIDDSTATALGVALNRSASLGEWNEPVLAEILKGLDAAGQLEGVGFSSDDLDALLDQLQMAEGADGDLDQIPEPPADPVTRRGDLWILGERGHRLLCGDSASREDLDRLLAGAPIHLVNMDPPYNVKVEPRSNNAIAAGLSSFTQTHHQKLDVSRHPEKSQPTTKRMRAKDRPLANDFVSDAAFAELLSKWFGNASRVLLPGRSFYVWGGYSNLGNYPPALKNAGLYFSQAIVWDKQHPVLTRKDFLGCFELAYYGWKEGAAHEFFGPNNALDLWPIKKVAPQNMIHLTEKCVELATRALLYSSRRGENVLDLFGGSGSTLVAAEQAQRRAFLMEIDPPYCDVILTRFRDLFHVEPRLESTGRTFSEVAAERASGTAAATTAS